MERMQLVLSFLLLVCALGCKENEQSFYIEHMKVSPEPPECSSSIGDKEMPFVNLNIMTANMPHASFQATNAVASREDYGRLRAESNGIQVDGYELYTVVPGYGTIGGVQYFDYNTYLDAESTGLLWSQFMTSDTIDFLRLRYRCEYYSSARIADLIFYSFVSNEQALRGTTLTADEAAIANSANAEFARLVDYEVSEETMYSSVRFLGHTQGDKEVETPEFTVVIHPYCGPIGGWSSCINDICYAFCSDNATEVQECFTGVGPRYTCADYLAGNQDRQVTYYDPDLNEGAGGYTSDSVCSFFNCK
ncbi:MAG: hypothetical protein JXR76_05900 [Deltaproteobacteria bacterium]|nr:hypothetical protein [Deltaproteobacteria bacterium]